jgi:hypothetical protein
VDEPTVDQGRPTGGSLCRCLGVMVSHGAGSSDPRYGHFLFPPWSRFGAIVLAWWLEGAGSRRHGRLSRDREGPAQARSIQRHPSLPEQRVSFSLQRADYRPDAVPGHQPATAARLPHAAGALQDVGEVLRAADRHHASELGSPEAHVETVRAQGRHGLERQNTIGSPVGAEYVLRCYTVPN